MPEATVLPGFDERWVELRGEALRYFAGGSGPPLLLLHGLGGAAANWAELGAILARNRRVIVPDLPGHGRSSALSGAHGLASFADRVRLLAEHEEAIPAPVVGHSLGGAVATRLAIRHADAVAAIVLLAGAGLVEFTACRRTTMTLSRALRPAERYLVRHRDEVARRPRLRRLAFGWGAARPGALTPAAVQGFLEGAEHRLDTRTARHALWAESSREELDKIACPALLVWGARDRLVPLEVGFEYARRLRAPLRVLPAAGHLLIGEYPRECADLVEGFLAGCRDAAVPA